MTEKMAHIYNMKYYTGDISPFGNYFNRKNFLSRTGKMKIKRWY